MQYFDQAYAFLTGTFGPLGPLFAVGILGALLMMVAIILYLNRRPDPLDKLRAAQKAAERAQRSAASGTKRLRHDDNRTKKLDKFAHYLEPTDQKELSATRLKLLQAGYRGRGTVRAFHAAQMGLGLIGLLGGLFYATVLLAGEFNLKNVLLAIALPGGGGYYLPIYWIERRRQTRQEEITNGFPDSLDLMLVCVEAGQSLDQAIIRVAKEIRAGYPALADEFEIVAHEIKAGKDKATVLRDMGERCGVQDISSFVTVLIQSATFGTSIAEALRVFSGEMRDKRVMRAEEKANVLPTKLTLGTMMFTVPPLLIILIGPSVYNIFELLG